MKSETVAEPIELQVSRIKSFLSEIERVMPMIKKMSEGYQADVSLGGKK